MSASSQCLWCRCPFEVTVQQCGRCRMPVLPTATRIDRRGRRFVLGQAGADVVAIWDMQRPAEPSLCEPAERLDYLSSVFDYWEAQTPAPIPGVQRLGLDPALLVVVVVFACLVLMGGGYVLVHAFRYRGCLFQPGIFSWPTVCL